MPRKKTPEFLDQELLDYMALDSKKKLEHLDHMNKFLRKIRPPQSYKIAQRLNKEGFF